MSRVPSSGLFSQKMGSEIRDIRRNMSRKYKPSDVSFLNWRNITGARNAGAKILPSKYLRGILRITKLKLVNSNSRQRVLRKHSRADKARARICQSDSAPIIVARSVVYKQFMLTQKAL